MRVHRAGATGSAVALNIIAVGILGVFPVAATVADAGSEHVATSVVAGVHTDDMGYDGLAPNDMGYD